MREWVDSCLLRAGTGECMRRWGQLWAKYGQIVVKRDKKGAENVQKGEKSSKNP